MIGILIVTHAGLGTALVEAGEVMMGERLEAVASVSIDINKPPEKLRKKISDGIRLVDSGRGVLILTDMFGGTPSNHSYSFLEEGRVEVMSGANLPMLLDALNMRENMKFREFCPALEESARKSISLAGAILNRAVSDNSAA